MKFRKNFNINFRVKKLRYKILLPIVIVVSIFYFLAVGYLIERVYTSRLTDTKRFIDAVSIQNANKIGNELMRYYSITKTMSDILENSAIKDSSKLHSSDSKIILNVLKNNPDFFTVWISRQFFSYKKNWTPKYGRNRLSAYVSKMNDSLDIENVYLDLAGESGLYKKIHKNNKDVIIEPYLDSTGDTDSVWMTSICVPISKNNEFIGLGGIDITLAKITDLVYQIEPYMESNAFLISAQGNYIAHENREYRGKNISEIQSQDSTLIKQIKKGKNFSFIKNKQDTKYYVSFAAIDMGADVQPWMIGIAVPVSNINKEAGDSIFNALIIGIAGLLIMILLIFRIAANISRPIKDGINFAENVAKGNLTAKLKIKGNDEIAQLGKYLNIMREKIRAIIEQVQRLSISLSDSSSFLEHTSEKLTENANEQASSAEEISSSMEVMVSSIRENSENSDKTKAISKKTASDVKSSERNVLKSESIINTIAEKIQVINDIAFQVHILSLNTAIEAAHAGKFGKGFTTIAQEIRTLAEKSQISADEIISLTENSVKITHLSSNSLKALVPEIIETSKLMSSVSEAGKEQTQGASQINSAISNLNDIVQQNSSFAENISERASDLKNEVIALNQLVTIFKTE